MRAAGGAGLRPVGRGPGPGLHRPGRLPRLVGRRAALVRDRPGCGDTRLSGRRAGTRYLAGDHRYPPAARRGGGLPAGGGGEQQARASSGRNLCPRRRRRCRPGSALRPGGCRPVPAGAGWPATSTPTRCIRTGHRRSPSYLVLPPDWVWTSSRSPITTRSVTTVSFRPPRPGTASPCCPARRSPPPAATRARWARSAGSTSACPPTPGWSRPSGAAGCCRSTTRSPGTCSWTLPMRERPPLVEVWHWSWLDLRWTLPLAWWLAWDPGAIPVGGSDWHRPGSDAPPGTPTTWVECAADGPGAVLDGLRDGRVAISGRRDGPVLLRSGRRDDRGGCGGNHPGGPGRAAGAGAAAAGELPRGGWPPPAARRHRRHPRPDPLSWITCLPRGRIRWRREAALSAAGHR